MPVGSGVGRRKARSRGGQSESLQCRIGADLQKILGDRFGVPGTPGNRMRLPWVGVCEKDFHLPEASASSASSENKRPTEGTLPQLGMY